MTTVGKSTKLYTSFDPRSLGNCALWLDAADANSLVLSGSNVTSWRDKSGSGSNATASPTPPTYSASTKYILFNGTNQYFSLPNGSLPSGNSAYSIFLVSYATAITSATPYWILSGGTTSANQAFGVLYYTTNAVYHSWWVNEYKVDNAVTPGVPAIINVNYTSTRSTIVNGGTATTNSPGATRNQATTNNVIGAAPNLVQFLLGGIGEILVYSEELSQTSRQQVEGYLAWKWQTSSSFNPSAFVPTSINGCSLWLDGADTTTLTLSGSNVTAWADKSGNAFNATATVTPTYNSTTKYLLFNGTQYMSLPNSSLPAGNGAYSIFIVSYPTTITSATAFWLLAGGTTTANQALGILYYTTNAVYHSWWVNEYKVDNVAAANVPAIINVNYTVNRSTIINGGTPTFNAPGTTRSQATTNNVIGASPNLVQFHSGGIAEIIVFTQELSQPQRQQVEDYLSRKWSISLARSTSGLPSTNPYASLPPFQRAFTPLDISGCSLWLDAADPRTVSLSGSNVTSWTDKSGNGRDAFQGTSANQPTYSNSALSFSGSQNLLCSLSASNANETVFAVVNPSTPVGANTIFGAIPSLSNGIGGDGGRNIDFVTDSGGQFRILRQYVALQVQGPFTTFGTRALVETRTDGSTAQVYSNGALLASASFVAYASGLVTIIGRNGRDTTNYFRGEMNEIVVYDTALTSSQRQLVEAYLANKWGLRSSFPLFPIAPAFAPTQISNCALWLDAADPSTLTLSGSTVTAWQDKSGNNRVINSTSGYSPTYGATALNGYPGIQFSSSGNGNHMKGTFFNSTQMTYCLAYSNPSTAGFGMLLAFEGGTFYGNLNTPYDFTTSDTFLWLGQPPPSNWPTTGRYPTDARITGPRIYSIHVNGTSSTMWRNGTAMTMAGSGFAGSGTDTTIGIGMPTPPANDKWNGTVSEIIIFNYLLPNTQRQQVELYLSKKWNISVAASTQPTTALARISPGLSPQFTPVLLSGLSLWLDAADLSTITLSGSNVTAWRDKSGNSNNPTFGTNKPTYTNGYVLTSNLNQQFTVPASVLSTTGGSTGSFFIVYGDTQTGGSNYTSLFGTQVNGESFFQTLKRPDPFSYAAMNSNSWGVTAFTTVMNTTNTLLYNVNYAYGSTSGSILVNGTSYVTIPFGTVQPATTLTISGEGYGGASGNVPLRMYEIISYKTQLSGFQRQQVEGYLAWKWGLQASLPSTHPYRMTKLY